MVGPQRRILLVVQCVGLMWVCLSCNRLRITFIIIPPCKQLA
jgi:hypothetical protein